MKRIAHSVSYWSRLFVSLVVAWLAFAFAQSSFETAMIGGLVLLYATIRASALWQMDRSHGLAVSTHEQLAGLATQLGHPQMSDVDSSLGLARKAAKDAKHENMLERATLGVIIVGTLIALAYAWLESAGIFL